MTKTDLVARVAELEGALREACDIGMRAHHSGGAGWRAALADLRKVASCPIDDQSPAASTRSSKSEDARRDFDGFDVDEELRRLRLAMRDGQWRSAAELTSNIDEHLCRGGDFPVGWLGPSCMQDAADLEERIRSSLARQEAMFPAARRIARAHVEVRPLPATLPSSAWGAYCHEDDCVETLTLRRVTAARTTDEEDWGDLSPAHAEAAVLLGWRLCGGFWWCPTHVAAKKLACARCSAACPACSCMGGPRPDAVVGTRP